MSFFVNGNWELFFLKHEDNMMKITGSNDVCIKFHKFLMTKISVCPKIVHEERTWLQHMTDSAGRKDHVLQSLTFI